MKQWQRWTCLIVGLVCLGITINLVVFFFIYADETGDTISEHSVYVEITIFSMIVSVIFTGVIGISLIGVFILNPTEEGMNNERDRLISKDGESAS